MSGLLSTSDVKFMLARLRPVVLNARLIVQGGLGLLSLDEATVALAALVLIVLSSTAVRHRKLQCSSWQLAVMVATTMVRTEALRQLWNL